MKLFADLIDAFQHAEGPPPDRLWPFMAWALRGAFPAIGIALAVSLVVGSSEVVAAALVGWLIDLAQSRGAEGLFADSWPWLLAACFFFLIFRPGFMGLGAALNALTLGPNLYPLVLSRLNRHTLGQSLSFFDDDFAGRIAQKQQQTARAITEAVSESVNTLGFAVTAIVGAVAVVGAVNLWLALAMTVWLGGYAVLIRHFMPKIRGPLQGARRGAGGGDRAGGRHHHQHRHRQALQPRPARGPGGAAGARGLPRRHHQLRPRQRRLPLLADDARRHPAGDADRRRAPALDPRRRRPPATSPPPG